MTHYLTASMLYAASQGEACTGPDRCHWCGAPCERAQPHDDEPPIPFVKNPRLALYPGNAYICQGCWLWRRGSVSVRSLKGVLQDRQQPAKCSWWVTPGGAWTITNADKDRLYTKLLSPPKTFFLSVLDGSAVPNLLQFVPVNEQETVQRDTALCFSLNNIPHSYTIYELETAILHGSEGREPGVRALCRWLGDCPPEYRPTPPEPPSETRKPPPRGSSEPPPRRFVRTSGIPRV